MIDMSRMAALDVLARMRRLVTHSPRHVPEPPFCDDAICATRVRPAALGTGRQRSVEAGLAVWLDGEFYNRTQLARQCSPVPVGDVPLDDATLLLRLSRSHPDFSFLREINGMFAAVIYDSTEQKVHLISDRHGLRHLFWMRHDHSIAWASETKAMLALPLFTPRIDTSVLPDFLRLGHMLDTRTWLAGVALLPAATRLTFDLRAARIDTARYWSWDEITPMMGRVDEEELAGEMGRRLRASVARRSRPGERVGLMLSGGLDSRALLAAMPDRGVPIHAVTFGRADCADVAIAAKAAALKGAVHHVFELSAENWLSNRVSGVWWTDGHASLMHLHAVVLVPAIQDFFDVCLDGFVGDAKGSYLKRRGTVVDNIDNRGRRFIVLGSAALRVSVEARLPFFDNEVMELVMATPEALRKDAHIYRKMLLLTFPEFFQSIPWQKTGTPIAWPTGHPKRLRVGHAVIRRIRGRLYPHGLPSPPSSGHTDYSTWIRREPARSFFHAMLHDPNALYPQYVPRERVMRLWSSHVDSGMDHAELLCRALTLEIWLQQLVEGRLRPDRLETNGDLQRAHAPVADLS
jgi:asparagine synthase (glutamine-hydrolysing)